MSQITAEHAMGHGHHHDHHADLSEANIQPGGFGRTSGLALLVLGAASVLAAILGGWGSAGAAHVLASLHVGAMTALACSLGALFFVMAFHLTGAGWSTTLRRQFENVASMVPFAGIAVIAILAVDVAQGGKLFAWLNKELSGNDYLYNKKSGYLNPMFFMLRAVFFVFAWSYLAYRLTWYSKEQDRTGDKWLSNRARFTSSWGMLVFALTVAFAAFDWLKSIDWRYFSTMWGVYYFAGAMGASIATVVLLMAALRAKGKLEGLVTAEHTHDLGKLLFAVGACFWAYIAYSQFFLTWYANIPEETSFYLARLTGGWENLFWVLAFGHFVLPFYLLLWRGARRTLGVLAIFALWQLLMQIADMFWIVRPQIYAGPDFEDKIGVAHLWVDAAGILGVLALFFGLLLRKVGSGVLIPFRDPRLHEAIAHKNYI